MRLSKRQFAAMAALAGIAATRNAGSANRTSAVGDVASEALNLTAVKFKW
jgi:hypothetical protein